MFVLGEALPKNREPNSGELHFYKSVGGNNNGISIVTKDGVTLDAAYIKNTRGEFKKTIILFGGMLGGFTGMVRYANWFRNNSDVNTILASRRGQDKSQGSTVLSGELGMFYVSFSNCRIYKE